MRRWVLAGLLGALVWLLAARAAVPAAVTAAAMDMTWDKQLYNVLDMDRASLSGTAGSALLAETDSYFLGRSPTARHSLTGSLAGKDLILLLAEDWRPEQMDAGQSPALYRLWDGGAHFTEMYAPDWYQDQDGREFALLSGLVPTAVGDRTAMVWVGEHGTCLPFALARCLASAGYTCRAWAAGSDRDASYGALGFSTVEAGTGGDLAGALDELARSRPYFAYGVLSGTDGESALARLWQALDERGLAEDTAICLITGNTEPLRGHLFLYGPGLADTQVTLPCSELDVTPTLLDLFGAAYDARFLSGRDMFAPAQPGPRALVSLYGSAYSDWVTDAGSYAAGESVFFPVDSRFDSRQPDEYVSQVCREVYDRYAYARQVLESDYFRAVTGRQKAVAFGEETAYNTGG